MREENNVFFKFIEYAVRSLRRFFIFYLKIFFLNKCAKSMKYSKFCQSNSDRFAVNTRRAVVSMRKSTVKINAIIFNGRTLEIILRFSMNEILNFSLTNTSKLLTIYLKQERMGVHLKKCRYYWRLSTRSILYSRRF